MKKDNAYIIAALITSLEAIGVAIGCGLVEAQIVTDLFWFYFPMWIVPAICVAGLAIYGLVVLGVWIYLNIMFRKVDKMDFPIVEPDHIDEEKK